MATLIPSDSQRAFLEEASKRYNQNITPEGVEYLTGRGISPESIDRFRLGVVVDPSPGHEQYEGMLSIPYLTSYGVTTIRYRRMGDGDGPKYLSPPADPARIYNPRALERGTPGICLAEGEFDCIIAEQCGLTCIGLPGAQSWNPVMARLLEDYEVVALLQDDDTAGEGMSSKLGKRLHNLRSVPMDGGDVTDFFLVYGRDELRKKVLGK